MLFLWFCQSLSGIIRLMIKAIIFDMDGVIIDSEYLQSQGFESVLREYGKQPIYNAAGIVQVVGMRREDNWHRLAQLHDLNEDLQVLVDKSRATYDKLLADQLIPMPGIH